MSLDRLSNMVSSLKNAVMAGNSYVEILYTKECEGVAKVLKEAGFIDDIKSFKPKGKKYKGLRLGITMDGEKPVLSEVKRLSRPGKRLYVSSAELKPVLGGHGVLVISTSRGIMSGEEARKKNLGGELICQAH